MLKTKIVCTLGPASNSTEMIEKMARAGMNVARLNFSHGTHEEQRGKYERFVKVREELGLPVAALIDTKGPEIRVGNFKNGAVQSVVTQNGVSEMSLRDREVLEKIIRENTFGVDTNLEIVCSSCGQDISGEVGQSNFL